jgi:hypothetical protein
VCVYAHFLTHVFFERGKVFFVCSFIYRLCQLLIYFLDFGRHHVDQDMRHEEALGDEIWGRDRPALRSTIILQKT